MSSQITLKYLSRDNTMQRTIRARMLNKLIYLLNNTDIESLEYEIKQQGIKSKYTLLFTILCENQPFSTIPEEGYFFCCIVWL